MPDITWKYIDNQFDSATKGSFKKMLTLSTDHDAKLYGQQTDPLILPLYTRFHTQHLAYEAAYTVWTGAQGLYAGGTDAVEQMLEELSSTKARQWDVKVMAVFDEGTPSHTAIFPNGRAPFQNGTIEQRIAAVATLHDLMTAHGASLPAPLLTEVLDFHTTLVALRTAQQAREGAADDGSTFLELARVATAQLMYGNLGLLMDIFRATPQSLADFYELSIIRRSGQDEEEEPVPPVDPPPAP